MKRKIKIIVALAMMVFIIQMPLVASAQSILHIQIDTMKEMSEPKDIVDIATSDGRFKTLTAALEAAGLVDTLKSEGPFTVFAPTDDAFSKLPAGKIDELLRPENKNVLTDILTYHVFKDKVTAADVAKLNGKEITMANGKNAKIEVKGDSVFIDGAKVIITDIMAKNGVIHVIDTVMMP